MAIPHLSLAMALIPFFAGPAWSAPTATAALPVSLKVIQISPANGAANACTDTPLHVLFSAPPALAKSGAIQFLDDTGAVIDSIDASAPTRRKSIGGLPNFNDCPILLDGNEATIAFNNNLLAYGKTYHIKITGSPFTDPQGHPIDLPADWHFTTRPQPPALPADAPRRITISADGSSDFATLQGALDSIPENNTTPTTLFLRNGTYHEIVYASAKHNLTILGEDRQKTILAYPNNQNLNNTDRPAMPGGYRRGMFRAVNCRDLTLANLTFHNTTPQGGSQAEAIILNGGPDAHAILTRLDLQSFQDTLQINGQAYISDCQIDGDVDFMWGTGPVFFENCTCRALRRNAFYTQIRNTAATHGFIYDHCLFEGATGVTGCLLSRIDPSRFPSSEVVLLNCTLTSAVSDIAWRFDNFSNPAPTPNVHFWESNSTGPDAKPIDDSHRFPASQRLSNDKDAGTIAHYADPKWVLGGSWSPILPPDLFPKH